VGSVNTATHVSELIQNAFGYYLGSDTPLFGSMFPYLNYHFPLDTRELSSNVNLVAKSSIGPVKNTFLLGADYDVVADKACIDVGLVGMVDFANPAFPSYTTPVTPVLSADNTYQNSGLTAQLQSSIWNRVHLLAGVRLAHVG